MSSFKLSEAVALLDLVLHLEINTQQLKTRSGTAALPNRHASMRNSREFDAWVNEPIGIRQAFHFCLNLCILTANCKHRSIFPYSTSGTRFQMRLYFQIKVRTFTTPPNGKGFNWKLHKHVACGSKFWTSWEIRNPRLTLGVGRSGQILNQTSPPFSPWGDLDVGSSWPKTSPTWPQGVMFFMFLGQPHSMTSQSFQTPKVTRTILKRAMA